MVKQQEGNTMQHDETLAPVNWRGHAKRAEPGEIDDLTSRGWRILGAYADDVVETSYNEEPNPRPKDPHDYTYSSTISTRRDIRCRRTWFLVGLDEDTTLSRQAEKMAVLEELVRATERDLEDVQKRLELAEREREATRSDLASAKSRLETAEKDARTEREQRRKMEADMAKVRAAVGDLRWREILEG